MILQPTFLVCKVLRSGQLVRILKNWQTDEFNIYAVYPNRQLLASKERSFIDFLLEYFGPEPNWDQGIA